ncbi:MAG: gliding motility-associated C-terminal domain-containing protein [Ferruginibacter sp.]|nr:gliding motility-associated C-terminal domain-containing protein [Cytophagales bacterium]
MRRLLMYVGLPVLTHFSLCAQVIDCSNIGFEEGTFRGWVCSNGELDTGIGIFKLGFIGEVPGTIDNGHYLAKVSDGNDPLITQEKIPMVAPGSRYSIRIGNAQVGAKFDRIRTTLIVSPDNALFQYKFAVILQDPNHEPSYQPALRIRIMNADRTAIPCGSYEVSAAKTVAGFSSQGNLRYRNWTTGLIDLRSYIGQSVTIEVTTNDCAVGGHFGYAYFDAQCLKAEVNATAFCSDRDTTLVLSAPAGFDHYRWNTGDTTRLLTVKPRFGDRYTVEVGSFSSLSEDCQLQLQYQVDDLVGAIIQRVTLCAGESYHVGDSIYAKSGTYRTTIRRTAPLCDSVVITHLRVQPAVSFTQQLTICAGDRYPVGDSVYAKEGTYVNRIKRAAPLCDSVVTTRLSVTRIPVEPIQDPVISLGDSVQLTARLPLANNYVFSWLPAEGLSCPSCETTWARPSKTTQYTLSIKTTNPTCEASQSVTVTVNPCQVYIPSAFSPNDDQLNDVFAPVATPCLRQIKEITLYNRWGEALFRKKNLPASVLPYGWDGTYKGKPVSTGLYAYQIEVELINGETMQYTGAVTLLR